MDIEKAADLGAFPISEREVHVDRIELGTDKLAQYKLTLTDVATAFTYSATTMGRLPDQEAFESIILRSEENAAALRLKDVARVELGAQSYTVTAELNGTPAVPIAVYLHPGANVLAPMKAMTARTDGLKNDLPDGIDY